MKKIISLLIIISMMTLMLASCAGKTDSAQTSAKSGEEQSEVTEVQSSDETKGATENPDVTEAPVTTFENMEDIYARYDLGEETYYIMCLAPNAGANILTDRYNQFCADEDNGDQLNAALFLRERKVEELFNCDIQTITEGCDRKNVGQKLRTAIETENTDICAALVGGYTLRDIFSSEYLYDLSEISTINLDKEWWNQQNVKDLTVNGKTYAAGGDISMRHMLSGVCIFFNKSLVSRTLSGVDLYKEVRDGKWTMDQLAKYSELLTKETNGDDKITYEDQIGLVATETTGTMLINSAGEYGIKNDGKTLSFNLYGNERAERMMDKWFDLFQKPGTLPLSAFPNDNNDVEFDAFPNDRIGFLVTQLFSAFSFRSMESDFGMIPLPKLDEEQDRYYTPTSYYYSGFMVIPSSYPNPEIAGALIDALSYYGHIYNRRAVYEYSYESMKILRDSDSLEMFNLMVDSQITDLLWLYDYQNIRSTITSFATKKSYASSIKKLQKSMDIDIENLLRNSFGISK